MKTNEPITIEHDHDTDQPTQQQITLDKNFNATITITQEDITQEDIDTEHHHQQTIKYFPIPHEY